MKINDKYDVYIKVANQDLELDYKQMSFRLDFSIWDALPKGFFVFNDDTGQLQENYIFIPGTDLSIEYGIDSTFVKGDFVVNNNLLSDGSTKNTISGDVELSLIHRWLKGQEALTGSYSNRISLIINQLANKYKFDGAVVNDTGNENTWYQLGKTDYEFIKDLTKTAYSKNANNTPFFFYIDDKNYFQFRNYKSLWNAGLITTLEKKDDDTTFDDNSIIDYSRKNMEYVKNKRKANTQYFFINEQTGNIEDDTITITDFLFKTNEKLPFISSGTTDDILFLDKVTREEEDSYIGELRYYYRDIFFQEEFVIITPFNPKLKVGGKVSIEFKQSEIGKVEATAISNYSGDYIIEKTSHIFEGEDNQFITKMVVGRPSFKANESVYYNLKEALTI
jgi:hypothetical protein